MNIQTKPEYRDSNPKIDMYDSQGTYIASTNQWRTLRDASTYYMGKIVEGACVHHMMIDRKAK